MNRINNPSEIGDVKSFIRAHAGEAVHVCSSAYSHYYKIEAEGFSVGIRRSQYAGFENAYPVCWMDADRSDEVTEAVRGAAKWDV